MVIAKNLWYITHMDLSFYSYLDEYNYLEEEYENILSFTFKYLSLKAEPIISVSIVEEKLIQEINRDYRNKDTVTDVISFAFLDGEPSLRDNLYKDGPIDLGEIYICLNRAIEQAKDYGHSLKRELSFLFLHGLLHLLGYDHMEKEDEIIMFDLQDKILSELGVNR